MTKYFCDRCKKEVPKPNQGRNVKVYAESATTHSSFICYPCAELLYDWLKGLVK